MQSYVPQDPLKTPGFFTAAIQAENENPFELSFLNGNASLERSMTDDQQQEQNDQKNYMGSLAEGYNPPSFGFSPQPSPLLHNSSLPPLSTAPSNVQLMAWNTSMQGKPFHYKNPFCQVQEYSPPSSAKDSPEQWPYNAFRTQSNISPLPSIMTQNHPGNLRLHHGQATPPDDFMPDAFETQVQKDAPQPPTEQLNANGKRKRAYKSTKNGIPSTKRSRKGYGRSKATQHSLDRAEPGNPEDEKRSKFLERNRVAASKCRQKKKEWTSSLEARARELQNTKNQFALVVSSLKDEILFLKGEMLKHNGCQCARISEYLDNEATNLAHPILSHQAFESAASPVRSEPTSRAGSVSTESASPHSRGDSRDSVDKTETSEDSDVVHFKSEDQLGELLSRRLVHDTSDEALANILAR